MTTAVEGRRGLERNVGGHAWPEWPMEGILGFILYGMEAFGAS